jgi:hypothetical protein
LSAIMQWCRVGNAHHKRYININWIELYGVIVILYERYFYFIPNRFIFHKTTSRTHDLTFIFVNDR